jgi:hypothetical protein
MEGRLKVYSITCLFSSKNLSFYPLHPLIPPTIQFIHLPLSLIARALTLGALCFVFNIS